MRLLVRKTELFTIGNVPFAIRSSLTQRVEMKLPMLLIMLLDMTLFISRGRCRQLNLMAQLSIMNVINVANSSWMKQVLNR